MKILSYKKIKNNLYELSLDNHTKINLYDEIILKENLLVKKNVEESYLNELICQNNFYELYHLAIKFMKNKMRSEKEIYQKFNKFYSNKDIEKVVDKLRNDGYLNDQLYIKAYVNDALNLKLVGAEKIKRDLEILGFNKVDIINYLDNIDKQIWLDKIEKYTNKLIKNNKKLSSSALKQKIISDLVNKGFKREDVIDCLNGVKITINKEIYEKEYEKLYKKLSKKYTGDKLNYEISMRLKVKGFGEFI